jgi:hypothetical protein
MAGPSIAVVSIALDAGPDSVADGAGAVAAADSSPFWGPDPEQAAIRLVNNARQTMPERVLRRLCWRIRTIPRAPL